MAKNTDADNLLQKSYEHALEVLLVSDPASKEYSTVFKKVQKLKEMLDANKREPLSPNELLKAGALLAAIFGIMAYETRNAWVTKAGPFIMKFL